MENFAEYILAEEDLAAKIEIVYYLSKKANIFFDKSVIVKTELARLFLKHSKIELDKNMILTACLLCNCKKTKELKDINKIKLYAKEGSNYLRGMGFSKRFAKICEELNRYTNSNPREKESDVLELVDQFGGMILDRPERIGFKADEALVLLEHRNLKNEYNRYLESFIEFINYLDDIKKHYNVNVIENLTSLYNKTEELTKFIQEIVYEFEPKTDKIIEKYNDNILDEMVANNNANRALFSEETAKKIIGHLNYKEISESKLD